MEIGTTFIGCYQDPNHPEGYRRIRMTDKYDGDQRIGSCEGSDTGMKKEYTLPVLAGRTSDNVDTIIIDFSSKGGPADLHGTWEDDETET